MDQINGGIEMKIVKPEPEMEIILYGKSYWADQDVVVAFPSLELMSNILSVKDFLAMCGRMKFSLELFVNKTDEVATRIMTKGVPVEGFWSEEFEQVAFDKRPKLSHYLSRHRGKSKFDYFNNSSKKRLIPICDLCGGDLFVYTSTVLTSSPPKYNLSCGSCDFKSYIQCDIAQKAIKEN